MSLVVDFDWEKDNPRKRSTALHKDDPRIMRADHPEEAEALEFVFIKPRRIHKRPHRYLQATERFVEGSYPSVRIRVKSSFAKWDHGFKEAQSPEQYQVTILVKCSS